MWNNEKCNNDAYINVVSQCIIKLLNAMYYY